MLSRTQLEIKDNLYATSFQPEFALKSQSFSSTEIKHELPAEGYVRLKQILSPAGPIPVSRATWWEGVRTGRFPKPTKFFGPAITAWNVKDIRDLIEQAERSREGE